MSNITPQQSLRDIDAAPGSLLEKLKGGGRFAANLLLCDISGSMAGRLMTEQTKIEALREAVNTLTTSRPNTRIVVFNHMAWDVDSIPGADGNTDLAQALRYLIANTPPKSLLLISDGHPDSPSDAITAADELGAQISALYIGDPGDRGEQFLKDLCARHAGTLQTDPHLLETPGLLAETIAGLLGSGNGETTPTDGGVIQL